MNHFYDAMESQGRIHNDDLFFILFMPYLFVGKLYLPKVIREFKVVILLTPTLSQAIEPLFKSVCLLCESL